MKYYDERLFLRVLSVMSRTRFSIVIETTNAHEDNDITLEQSFNEISSQARVLESYELILVDCTKTDRIKHILTHFPSIRHVPKPGAGYVESKNYGFTVSTGSIIVFVDCDCVLQQGWFDRVKNAFAQDNIDILTGYTHYPLRDTMCKVLTVLDFNPSRRFQPTRTFIANSVAVKREVLERHPFPEGLPNITAASNSILAWRWHYHGNRMYFDPQMEAIHNFYPNVFKNRLNAGFGNILVRKSERSFPFAKWLERLHVLFPLVFYLPRCTYDALRVVRMRCLLDLSVLQLPIACLLVLYYRFVDMLGMELALIYPRYFYRPGQVKKF